MNTLQKRILSAAAIVVVAGVAAYWYWSPYLAMRQLRNAAVAADAERFNEHVDFPKLRDSLKGQFSARIDKEVGERAGNSFGSMLALALVDKMIDVAVRPETIMSAMKEGRFKVGRSGAREGEGEHDTGERRDVVWSAERKGLDIVLVHVEDDERGARKEKLSLVMQREGFANWKLTDIRLPE